MKAALRLLLAPYRFTVDRLFRMGQVGWHWQFDDPNTLYRRRNLLTYTGGSYASPWATDNSGATNPTVTANYAQAPDGTMTAARVQLNKTGGVFSRLRCVVAWPTGRQYVVSVYARTTSGSGTANVGLRGGDAGGTNIAVSGAWQRFTYPLGTLTVSADFQLLLWDSIAGNDETADILIWGAQLELGTVATEYQDVPTTWEQAYLDAVGAERIYAWTDTAGTTPVTAIGDGIGLLLGREYGGYRGSEMASANYATTATYDNVTTVVSATAFTQTAGTTLGRSYLNLTTVVGKTYEVSSSITTTDASGILLYARALPGGTGTILATSPAIASGGTARVIFTATTTTSSVLWSTQTVARIVNGSAITIREIPGTHLTQATGTAKPTLSARVNLLLASETLGSTSWDNATPNLATVSGTLVTAATGGTGSMRRQVLTLIGGTALKTLFRLSAGTATKSRLIVRDNTNATQAQAFLDWSGGVPSLNGASNGTWTITLVGSQYWVVNTFTLGAGASIVTLVSLYPDSAAGTGNVNCHGIDLRTADDAAKNIPAYQRVGATATDHDTDGFPHYALADGTDDCWASVATVDGSATAKVTVVAAVTKNSDAAAGCVVELTATSASNNGAFILSAPTSAAVYQWRSKGTVQSDAATAASYPAPHSAVLTGTGDIGADVSTLRIDGALAASAATDQGTGNYSNATLYVLSRAGTSLRFNGRFYGSTGRFGPMGDSERNNLTRWWQKRIGTA